MPDVATDDEMKSVYDMTRFQMQYPKFLLETATDLLLGVMLPEIHAMMRSLGYSEKIIQGTTIQNIRADQNGSIRYEVISDYKSKSGFDVAKAREEGTSRHFVKPVAKLALSWLAGYIRLFSKGHWVRGITKSNVISKTKKRMEPRIQKALDDATDKFFLSITTGDST